MIVPYVPPWKKKPFSLMGSYLGDRNRSPQPNARFRQDPFPSMASDPTWSVESTYPAKTPQTSMAKKKGLGINDWMEAFGQLKPYTPKFGSLSARGVGGSGIKPSPRAQGVDALWMASDDDPKKKWWKQWQGLMGAV